MKQKANPRPARRVEHVTIAGGERATRVVDSLLLMRRSGQLDDASYAAALRYRRAFETAHGGGSSHLLDPCRTPSTPSSGPPSAHKLAAALILNEADRVLARVGGTGIVEMIAARGYSIDDAAGSLFGRDAHGRTKKSDRDHVGAFLRLSLRRLAEFWAGSKTLAERRGVR